MTSPRWRLAALPPLPESALRALAPAASVEVSVPPTRDQTGLLTVLADADLLLASWTQEFTVGPAEVAAAPHLAFVQQPSVGVEHLDLDALAAAGIPVANTAGANTVSVAEWCVAAVLALCRFLVWSDAEVRAGRWPQLELAERGSGELAGRRVGVLGFGAIGAACAQRFTALGCPVSYWSRRRRPPEEERGARYRELDDLLATSDVLVVVLALAAGTRGLLDSSRLAALPAGALLVNAARGEIVDEAALAAALAAGSLGGAALDVFAAEPLPAESPLRQSSRVLLSPHVAGATIQARQRIVGQTMANLARVVTGEAPVDVVNGIAGPVRRRR